MGLRLARVASGAATNCVATVESTHPAMREAFIRELLGSPLGRGQFGYPCTGCQGAESAVAWGGAGKYTLARIEGPATKGRNAEQAELGRIAKVGYCPCCSRATHIANPPRCKLGKYSCLKAAGEHC